MRKILYTMYLFNIYKIYNTWVISWRSSIWIFYLSLPPYKIKNMWNNRALDRFIAVNANFFYSLICTFVYLLFETSLKGIFCWLIYFLLKMNNTKIKIVLTKSIERFIKEKSFFKLKKKFCLLVIMEKQTKKRLSNRLWNNKKSSFSLDQNSLEWLNDS